MRECLHTTFNLCNLLIQNTQQRLFGEALAKQMCRPCGVVFCTDPRNYVSVLHWPAKSPGAGKDYILMEATTSYGLGLPTLPVPF